MDEFTNDFDLRISPADLRLERRRAFRKGLFFGAGGVLMGILALALFALVLIGVLIQTGAVPDTAALAGDDIPASTLAFLLDNGIVDEGEEVLFFYSDGLLSLREDGNLFTDRRVISYWENGDDLAIERAGYAEISAVAPKLKKGLFENSVVTIEREASYPFQLLVSNEGGADVEFVETLVETWERER